MKLFLVLLFAVVALSIAFDDLERDVIEEILEDDSEDDDSPLYIESDHYADRPRNDPKAWRSWGRALRKIGRHLPKAVKVARVIARSRGDEEIEFEKK